MCIAVVAWHSHPEYPLILASNRDEFYTRGTRPAAWWGQSVSVLAGRDDRPVVGHRVVPPAQPGADRGAATVGRGHHARSSGSGRRPHRDRPCEHGVRAGERLGVRQVRAAVERARDRLTQPQPE